MERTTTEQEIEKNKECKRLNQSLVASAKEILDALEKWENKNVDKRFFETFFLINNEYSTYTKYKIVPPRYIFSKAENELYIGNNEYVELLNRETSHVKEVLKAYIEKMQGWSKGYSDEISKLESVDEKKVVSELIEVYKRNRITSSLWKKILDSYAVKYPDDN